MELRFPKEDVNRCELLLLIPTCLVSSRWRYNREELVTRVDAAVKLYRDDLGTLDSFPTDLELWMNYGLVSVCLFIYLDDCELILVITMNAKNMFYIYGYNFIL